MTDMIIQATALSRTYATAGGAANTVLHDVSLEVSRGEFVVIMGPSGSGKSTLLYLLSGLDRPSAGSLLVGHRMLGGRSETELALLRRQSVGLVLQQHNLVPHLTLMENVMLPGLLGKAGRRAVAGRARALLDRFGLEQLHHRLPEEVSGGEQQRAAIARALINDPAVLLADEPTGSLNSAASRTVMEALQALNGAGQTIVLITHDIKTAGYGGRVLFMQDGRLDAPGLPRDAALSPAAAEARLLTWLGERGW